MSRRPADGSADCGSHGGGDHTAKEKAGADDDGLRPIDNQWDSSPPQTGTYISADVSREIRLRHYLFVDNSYNKPRAMQHEEINDDE